VWFIIIYIVPNKWHEPSKLNENNLKEPEIKDRNREAKRKLQTYAIGKKSTATRS
jgi:hypothetical protein